MTQPGYIQIKNLSIPEVEQHMDFTWYLFRSFRVFSFWSLIALLMTSLRTTGAFPLPKLTNAVRLLEADSLLLALGSVMSSNSLDLRRWRRVGKSVNIFRTCTLCLLSLLICIHLTSKTISKAHRRFWVWDFENIHKVICPLEHFLILFFETLYLSF